MTGWFWALIWVVAAAVATFVLAQLFEPRRDEEDEHEQL